MSDKENRSIAYIFNEMDPSEKLEFKRELERDSDLLIEVETLKNTAGKLDELGTVEPPEEAVRAIYRKVAENQGRRNTGSERYIWLSAAAVLLLFITSGLYFMDSGESTTRPGSEQGSAIIGGGSTLFPATDEESSGESTDERILPWIDHNEFIRFQDGVFSDDEAAVIDSIYRQSFQKLTPVTNPSQSATARQNLHLTGNR